MQVEYTPLVNSSDAWGPRLDISQKMIFQVFQTKFLQLFLLRPVYYPGYISEDILWSTISSLSKPELNTVLFGGFK